MCAQTMIRAKTGSRAVCVDHCHESHAVRGLLCNNCNRALGLLGDDPVVLQRATNYLTA